LNIRLKKAMFDASGNYEEQVKEIKSRGIGTFEIMLVMK